MRSYINNSIKDITLLSMQSKHGRVDLIHTPTIIDVCFIQS